MCDYKLTLKINQNITRLLLIFYLVLTATYAKAQKERPKNLPRFDHNLFHFGFILGINNADFTLHRKPPNQVFDSLMILDVTKQPGFNLGIVSELHITKNIKMRFVPSLSFAQRDINYQFQGKKYVAFVKQVESTYLEFPVLFKLKSDRVNNFSGYVIAGGKYSLDLASNEKADNAGNNLSDIVVKIRRNDYHFEAGWGMEFYLEYFKFGLELKMSYGIKNILVPDTPPTIFSSPIDVLRSKMFLLSFTFEG